MLKSAYTLLLTCSLMLCLTTLSAAADPEGGGGWIKKAKKGAPYCVRKDSLWFSPDGKYAVTTRRGSAYYLRKASTGDLIRKLQGSFLAFAPRGKHLLTRGKDHKTALLWETATGKQLRKFGGHSKLIDCAAFSPNEKYLVTGSEDGKNAILWEVSSGKQVKKLNLPCKGQAVYMKASFSPNGKYLAIYFWGKTLFAIVPKADIWEIPSGKRLHSLRRWESFATFSPDGKNLVIAGDRSFYVAQIKSLSTVAGFSRHHGLGQEDLKGFPYISYNLFRERSGESVVFVRYGTKHIRMASVALSPDGKYVLAVTKRGKSAALYDISTRKVVRTFKGHTDTVHSVAFSRDGKLVVTGSADRTARIWDAQTGKEKATQKVHSCGVLDVDFLPDGKSVRTLDLNGTIRLWSIDTPGSKH